MIFLNDDDMILNDEYDYLIDWWKEVFFLNIYNKECLCPKKREKLELPRLFSPSIQTFKTNAVALTIFVKSFESSIISIQGTNKRRIFIYPLRRFVIISGGRSLAQFSIRERVAWKIEKGDQIKKIIWREPLAINSPTPICPYNSWGSLSPLMELNEILKRFLLYPILRVYIYRKKEVD